MKELYLIGGAMGVGKTAVCQKLKQLLPNSVFLDGDWCWDADPFQVTEETKSMVLENIYFLLNQFLRCSAYDNVIFGWVLHRQDLIDGIFNHLNAGAFRVTCISLVCDAHTVRARLQKDVDRGIRAADVIERSLKYLPLYDSLNTVKLYTSCKTAEEAAEKIMQI